MHIEANELRRQHAEAARAAEDSAASQAYRDEMRAEVERIAASLTEQSQQAIWRSEHQHLQEAQGTIGQALARAKEEMAVRDLTESNLIQEQAEVERARLHANEAQVQQECLRLEQRSPAAARAGTP